MLKKLAVLAALLAGISGAHAVTGTPPGTGPGLQDGQWLNGLAGGLNNNYQYGVTAAGTTQTTATQLPTGVLLIEIDTAAASTGVNLPPALQGNQFIVYNNGAQTVTVYPAVANNPVTGVQDTINNGTTLSGGIASHTATEFFCAKNGIWAAK